MMHDLELQKDRKAEELHDSTDEGQLYLRVAELVLKQTSIALSAKEIKERGIEKGFFGDHTFGNTPEKSMQARLSTDILSKKSNSRIVRTARGRFFLRSKLEPRDPSINDDPRSEYVAPRRVLRIPSEEVLSVSDKDYPQYLTFQGIDTESATILDGLLKSENIGYIQRAEAENRNDAKQFVTYVFVQCGNRLLYFRRSYLSRAAEFLRGSKCIAFGGHVTEADFDMLSANDFGLSACTRRELSEELLLSIPQDATKSVQFAAEETHKYQRQETTRLFQSAPLELLGVLNDDSSEVGRRHLAVVYRVWIENWDIAKRLGKGDSSIKGLHWLDLTQDKVELEDFEYWSQLCLQKFFPANVISKSSYKIMRNVTSRKHLVVSGRIGSGKTETSRFISDQLQMKLISSGQILQELTGSAPLSEIGRREFQSIAMKFISTPNGPNQLAERLILEITKQNGAKCLIDGVRQLSTLEALRSKLNDDIAHLHVSTSPDLAYEMYRAREVDGVTLSHRDFFAIYDADVESEIQTVGRQADVYLYNTFGLTAFRRTLEELVTKFTIGENQRHTTD